MVNDILAGILLGICITLIILAITLFIARRKRWVDFIIAPAPSATPTVAMDHEALMNLFDHFEGLSAKLSDVSNRLDGLEAELSPYLNAEARKKAKD